MPRAPLTEEEAMRLFLACAVDARDAPIEPSPEDLELVRTIVRTLGKNRAAIHLAAARARDLSFADLSATLRELDQAAAPEPSLRVRLARGKSLRLHGRLGEAEAELTAVLERASSDAHARIEAHRSLGAVYRAQGRTREALAHKEQALELCLTLGDPARIAVARGEVGTILATLGELRRARGCHEQALAAHRELGRRENEGIELSYLGVSLHRAGLVEEARRAHQMALDLHREAKNPRSEAADRMHLGYVAIELDDTVGAREHLEAALSGFRTVGDRALEGIVLSYLGALESRLGRPERAGPLLQQALAVHHEVRSARHASTTEMHIGYHHGRLNEPEEERASYERALALGLSRSSGASELESENRAWLLGLTGRLDEAREVHVEDVGTRYALTLLEAALTTERNPGSIALDRARTLLDAPATKTALLTSSRVRKAWERLKRATTTESPELVIARDGRWFQTSKGPRVDLSRRKPLRLALLLLADRFASARGRGVSWSEVLEVAWPGERVDAESGFARVRNALAQLRKLGLRDVLKTRDDGYLLDPECPVRRAEI